MTVLGYARVSTADQSTNAQLDALTAAGAERIFTENASARTLARPQLDALLDYAREGDLIVVTAFDRLSRSVHDLMALTRTFDDRGIRFRSLREDVDTSTPTGRAFFHVVAAIAELERSNIAERTRGGLTAARARGAAIGRPPVLTDIVVAQVARMTDIDQLSRAEIAQLLKISVSTVSRARRAARDAAARQDAA